ncbi:ABC transporter permease [Maledivibacter halophilus]|uniref:ABC-2 type transport system permease protein n=1 Tax=Maledivibacter halophilus TaxID=36842 RepID=A0A1T5LZG9_9FIRM|nr:ABC transporter permease [Maledivibacter halophilus]SKC81396.1 ABC-2 type transport system permease protein [Maledivibacter halophilus]
MLSIIKLRFLMLRDEYKSIVLLTAMALGFTAVFGISNVDGYKPKVLIIDEDNSKYSQLFIEELKMSNSFEYEISNYDRGIKLVDEGKVLTAIILKNNFEKDIEMGKSPIIDILKLKDDIYIYRLEGLISNIFNKMISNIKISEAAADYIGRLKSINRQEIVSKTYLKALEAWEYEKPIVINQEMIERKGKSEYNHLKHMMIGFAIFFSTYTVVFSIGNILNDRKHNIWQRMLISPVSKTSILGGSMISAYIIGCIQLGILILGGKYLFGIDWGKSVLGIITIAASFVFTMTSLGLLLSGIVRTEAQLSAITPVVLTSTGMLGGCLWPLEIINSKVLLTIANFVPQKWAVEGMEKIAVNGYGFEAALMPSLVLLGMGLIYFMVGVRLVKFE